VKDLLTGEFNDIDNYLIRNGDNKGKYKQLFCTPLQTWSTDKDSKIQFRSNAEANISQVFIENGEKFYYQHLKTNVVGIDDEDKYHCGDGDDYCLPESVRDGDKMDVNRSWFDKDEIGEYEEVKLPDCEGESDDDRVAVDIYNVKEDGTQIVWTEADDRYDYCVARFKIREGYEDKPFIIEKWHSKRYVALVFDFGRAYFKDAFFEEGENMELFINDGRLDGEKRGGQDISWDVKDVEYKITRIYNLINRASTPHFLGPDSYTNYIDCNNDGDIDIDDADCQKPSELLLWMSGRYEGSNSSCPSDESDEDGNDVCCVVVKEQTYMAGYFYVATPFLGSADKFVNKNIVFDDNGNTVLVGGTNAYLQQVSAKTHPIRWKAPDRDMKLFLGDSDKCIYIPRVVINSENKQMKETEEENDDIKFDVHYFTNGSKIAICEQDVNMSFDYKILQRYTDDSDKEGNATEDEDYSADNYEGTVTIKRECDDCSDESCLPPEIVKITDFNVKNDDIKEKNELFDLNISNPKFVEFEQAEATVYKYIMTILDATTSNGIISFDAWDENSDKDEKQIYTKIVGQTFKITLASCDPNDSDKLKTTDDGVKVKYWLVSCPDADVKKEEPQKCVKISDSNIFDSDESSTQDVEISYNKAIKYGSIKITACVKKNDKNEEVEVLKYDDCDHDCEADDKEDTCWMSNLASDKFAIRPKEFKIVNLPEKVKAGEEFNITIQAVDENGDVVTDYNESFSLADDGGDKNVTMSYKELNSACDIDTLSHNKDFQDGELNLTLTYNEVGNIEFNLSEHDLYADVDKNDSDLSNLKIPTLQKQLIILPYKFKVDSEVKNFNNGDFTYISNDLNMSSEIKLIVKSLNKNGDITKNYSSACYAKNIDIFITHSTLPENVDYIHYKVDDSNELNVSSSENISFDDLSKDNFNDGEAVFLINLNVNKNYSKPVNEFNLSVNDANITDENNISAVDSLNKKITFRYARVKTSSISTYNDNAIIKVPYQYYNGGKWRKADFHTNKIYGDINQSYGDKLIDIQLNEDDINAMQHIDAKLNTAVRPYKATMHFNIPTWLWYSPNNVDYKTPSSSNTDCSTHPCVRLFFQKGTTFWVGKGTGESENNNSKKTINISIQHTKPDAGFRRVNW
jgi:hypothetical protein